MTITPELELIETRPDSWVLKHGDAELGRVSIRHDDGIRYDDLVKSYVPNHLKFDQKEKVWFFTNKRTKYTLPVVKSIEIDPSLRGKGIGAEIYKKLADHYGALFSDNVDTSPEARKAWLRAGAKQFPYRDLFEGDELKAANIIKRLYLGKKEF